MATAALLTWRLPYAQEERGSKNIPDIGFLIIHYTTLHDYTTLQYQTIPYPTLPYPSLPYPNLPYQALHFTLHCPRHYTTLHYNILHYTLHFTAPHYTALHYTTLLCSVALHLNTKQYLPYRNLHYPFIPYRTLPTLHTTLHYILHYTSIFHSGRFPFCFDSVNRALNTSRCEPRLS